MTKEEYAEHRKFFEDIRNNRTEEEKRIIAQKLKEDEEVRRYHRQGKIHPKDIEAAKDILEGKDSWQMRSNLSEKDIDRLVKWANHVLEKGCDV